MQGLQPRLVVEQFNMRRSTRLEQVNNPLGFRCEMSELGRGIGADPGIRGHQPRKRRRTQRGA